MQKFMIARFGVNKKIGLITEYRLVWNPQYFQKDKRIFDEHNITGLDFVKFMMESANIMTL